MLRRYGPTGRVGPSSRSAPIGRAVDHVAGDEDEAFDPGGRGRGQQVLRHRHVATEERLDSEPETSRALEQARDELVESLQELRELARGIHPAVVAGHGLEVALESLVARAPVPVRLTVDLDGRLPERIEMAAYYLVSEGLANVAKYARAAGAKVDITRRNGELVVEVVDDGVGGANTDGGAGIRGLADRVEALGGRLRVWSPGGGGTRVRAEIPCG